MLAEAVLSEEQKEVRFQKFYEKKKNQTLVKTEPEEDDEGSPPRQRKRTRKRKLGVKSEVTSSDGSPVEVQRNSLDDVMNFQLQQSMQGKIYLRKILFQ